MTDLKRWKGAEMAECGKDRRTRRGHDPPPRRRRWEAARQLVMVAAASGAPPRSPASSTQTICFSWVGEHDCV